MARRDGSNRDGRRYTITVSESDLAGNWGSAATEVVVPHDQRGGAKGAGMVLIPNAMRQTGEPMMIGWADVDGNGVVNVNDYIAARKKLGSRLP
jgi:hypothetical protein